MARRLAWADTHFDISLLTATGITGLNLLSTLEGNDTITVIRLIIKLYCLPQNLSDDLDGGAAVHMGIGVAANEAFVANALPDPGTPADVPARGWLWKDVMVAVQANTTGPSAHDTYWGTEVHADIRAMRKVDRGILYFVADSQDIGVSGVYLPINVVGLVRALCAT